MTFHARTLVLRGALLLGLLLAALGLGAGRRALIRQFFVDGAVPGDAPVWPRSPVGDGLTPVPRVRVVLLDGLSRAHAVQLPHLSALCARGRELQVDVGFPTVSLPVQHVLWTGRTQQQSGVQYHIGQLAEPPRGSLPRQIDSLAVAESHPEIVHSFGFGRAEPSADPAWDGLPAWRAHGFVPAAHAAVASPAPLAFIHVLRIDEAGHAPNLEHPRRVHDPRQRQPRARDRRQHPRDLPAIRHVRPRDRHPRPTSRDRRDRAGRARRGAAAMVRLRHRGADGRRRDRAALRQS